MDFAPIPPTQDLAKYLSKRKTWFALAQEVDFDYVDFYHKRDKDVTLILDNGAYEGELHLDMLVHAITLYTPDIVVLPDLLLGQSERSLYLSLGFLEQYGLSSAQYHNEWMFVPQAEPGDIDGFVNATRTAMKDKRITWVGIPRCLVTDITTDPLARYHFAKAMKKDHPDIKLHALGMINGCVPELYYLQKAGVLSCDSSWPFNHGNTDDNLKEIDQCLLRL